MNIDHGSLRGAGNIGYEVLDHDWKEIVKLRVIGGTGLSAGLGFLWGRFGECVRGIGGLSLIIKIAVNHLSNVILFITFVDSIPYVNSIYTNYTAYSTILYFIIGFFQLDF